MQPFEAITLICVYFGRFPSYSSLFFKSAGSNSDVSFLIFTDQTPPPFLPANIRFVRMGAPAFEELASRKLGQIMRLHSTRKLCDYKPAYGLIFSDYICRSIYWGHIDMDIVWGNISRFMQEPMAGGVQVISADGRRLSGPLTIYENTPQLCNLFRKIPDVFNKLNSGKSFDLDEKDFDSVIKSSGLSLLARGFDVRAEISPEELREFVADDYAYRQIIDGMELTSTTGRRLPAFWRSGEVWNCLPSVKANRIRLINSIFLHLTAAKVSFRVDLENDLILPVRRHRPAPPALTF